ncbi:MAG TPA: class I SAM-dependent methyltransferase [Rhizobiaceae bacterium]|nr:class I SAM-dependent methyltransferase [Rhizobiaceae bacterium]
MENVAYDETGKVDMNGIYDEDAPLAYFTMLKELDYMIPQNAQPMFSRLIAARRRMSGRQKLKIVDIGCSYGVNAAILKHGLSMAQLYRFYRGGVAQHREALMARDRALYSAPADENIQFIGLDQARNAITYAVDAGTLDAGVVTNLEETEPGPRDRIALAGSDLIISTGCFGYVTETSLERLLDAAGGSEPWMAHFVLRMFDFSEAEAMLSRHGYVTEKADGLFIQRRFASEEERESVFSNLAERGLTPTAEEEDGWYVAELYVARPQAQARAMPLPALIGDMSMTDN